MTSFHIAIWGNGNKIHETKAHFVGTARERNWVIFSLCPCYYLLIDRVCVNIHRTLCNTTLQDRQGHICQVMLPPRPSHLTRAVLPDQLLWKNYCPQVTYIEETMCSFCLFAACPFTVLGRRRENESALYFSHTQEKVSDGRLMIKGMKGDEGVNVCETKECVRMALPSLHSVPWMYPIKHANLRTEIHAIRVCSCLCHRIPHAVRKLPSLKQETSCQGLKTLGQLICLAEHNFNWACVASLKRTNQNYLRGFVKRKKNNSKKICSAPHNLWLKL